MALREEKGGGGGYTPPKPPVPEKPSTVLQGNRPKTRPTRTRTNNTGNSRNNALGRRASSSGSNRSRTPSNPPGGNSKIIRPAAPPKPVIPDTNSFLKGDSTYQRQLAAYAKSLADFQADQGLATTDYTTGYNSTRRDIGLAKEQAAGDLKNDYASRGLLQSSLYNTDVGELNQQYQNQYTDLDKQKAGFMSQLAQELNKYNSEQGTQKQNAQQEALRRRAEQYNL